MVVDQGKNTCSCRFWQLTGMPCMHAILAIQDKNDKRVAEYCHDWLKMEAYRGRIYGKNPHSAPVPLPIKPKPGRLTKKRRRDKEEQPTRSRSTFACTPSPIQPPSEIDISQSKSIPPTQDTQQVVSSLLNPKKFQLHLMI
ncbi:hypothetical protein Ahy_A10g048916 [Arachis hypogaea]|uniref:SWIM-type domain-containing protein n=1 Tax=Arachis hypogaea TaxID=3818 RepID=A0A445B667_ARAHY|nr:hypothetical protein Ahy_A10g048916 [Arachis hypogaea]